MKIEMIEKKFSQHFFVQVELSRGSTAPFKNHQGGPDFNKAEKRGHREREICTALRDRGASRCSPVAELQSRVESIFL